jgi:putative hydrolase of the HAD superfamily
MQELKNSARWVLLKSNMKSPKALLFDLGNVLLPIDLSLTYQAFSQLSTAYDPQQIQQKIVDEGLWLGYEAGLLDDDAFRSLLINKLALNCSNDEFDQAFSALLLDFPVNIYSFLANLSSEFDLYLLSNTSVIHSRIFLNNQLGPDGENLFGLFKKAYFSYEMGLVKPNPLIYQQVLRENNLEAGQLVFFDDNAANIESASKLGIDSILIDPKTSLSQISAKINVLC